MKKLAKAVVITSVSAMLLTNGLQVEAVMNHKSSSHSQTRSHNAYDYTLYHSSRQKNSTKPKVDIKKSDVQFKTEKVDSSTTFPATVKVSYKVPKKSRLYGKDVSYMYGFTGCPVVCVKELYVMSVKETSKGYKIQYGGVRDGDIIQKDDSSVRFFHMATNKGTMKVAFKNKAEYQAFKEKIEKNDWNNMNQALKKK